MIPAFLDDDAGVYLHTENGLLGVGPRPDENELDTDLIDAAKRPVTALAGRVVLRQRRELRDDPRRPHRRRRARRAAGQRAPATSRTGRCRARTCSASAARWISSSAQRRVIVTMTRDVLARSSPRSCRVHLPADREGGAVDVVVTELVRSSGSATAQLA